MTATTLLKELKQLGTVQNVKIYKRHGADGDLYGVSFANLNKLAKKHKGDTDLARGLWKSKNIDAQVFAMMIANPAEVSAKEIDAWVKEIRYTLLAGYFGSLVGKTKFADSRMRKWSRSKNEYVKDIGYSMLSARLRDGDSISHKTCEAFLGTIEAEIHSSPNQARRAMHNALMAIGIFRPELTKQAIATAKRIGKVEIDHGETNCKTPDAVSYIQKGAAHFKAKAKKKAAKTKRVPTKAAKAPTRTR